MELLLLSTLEYRVVTPTPCWFLHQLHNSYQQDNRSDMLSSMILESVLLTTNFLHVRPSLLAAAAYTMARMALHIFQPWPPFLSRVTMYSSSEVVHMGRLILSAKESIPVTLKSIVTKYSLVAYRRVASIQCPPSVCDGYNGDDDIVTSSSE